MRALIVAVLALTTAGVSAQTLTEDQIATAIKIGQAGKTDPLTSSCVATSGFGESFGAGLAGGLQYDGSFDVVVSLAAGRIAYLARNAKRLYQPFAVADVPEGLHTDGVYVLAEPQKPTSTAQGKQSVAGAIERIVLKSKSKPEVVAQPQSFDTEPVEWKNLLGATIPGNRAIASFVFSDVRELPAGDIDVAVITAAGERRCKVGTKDRAKLFGR